MLDTIMIYVVMMFLFGIVAWLIGLRFGEFDDRIKKLEKKIDELRKENNYEKDYIHRL